MRKKKIKIFDIEYLANEDLTEDDLYDVFETKSLMYSLLVNMFKYANYTMNDQEVIDKCKHNKNWMYNACWTKKERNEYEKTLVKVFKNIYQIDDYRARCKAQEWLVFYGLTIKGSKIDKPNYWEMKKKRCILVTGGTGYIGSHTVVELQEAGYDVVIVDNLSNSNVKVVKNIEKITKIRPKFYQVDLNNIDALEEVFKNHDFDAVIHFAAYKSVEESTKDPLLYYRNNLNTLINVLEMMKKHHANGIIFSSSCTVYGQPTKEDLPIKEDTPIQKAISPYGNTKQISEEIIQDFIKSNPNIKSVILRYFNPIGAHPSSLIGENATRITTNLVPLLIQTLQGEKEQFQIFGNDYNTPDGTCIRDYIYVVDLAKAHVKAMEYMLDELNRNIDVFNLGTGYGISTLKMVKAFERAAGKTINSVFASRRNGDVEAVWADAAKAKEILHWEAKTPLEDILKSALDYENHHKNILK